MKIQKPYPLVCFLSLVALGLTGCSPSGPQLGQVTGVVMMEGRPVPNLSIELMPSDGRPSLARTDEEGKFQAYYLPKQPGAVPGVHRLESEFVKSGPNDVTFKRPRRRGSGPRKPLVLEPAKIEVQAGESVEVQLQLVEAS